MEINLFKKKKVFVKTKSEPDPDVYWIMIFYICLSLVLASFAFGFYMFNTINREEDDSFQVENKELEKIGKERIDKALLIFAEKAGKSSQIINSPSGLVDPSL